MAYNADVNFVDDLVSHYNAQIPEDRIYKELDNVIGDTVIKSINHYVPFLMQISVQILHGHRNSIKLLEYPDNLKHALYKDNIHASLTADSKELKCTDITN